MLDTTVTLNSVYRTHMQDLIDMTNDAHYENYRSQRLSVLTGGGTTITTRYDIIFKA